MMNQEIAMPKIDTGALMQDILDYLGTQYPQSTTRQHETGIYLQIGNRCYRLTLVSMSMQQQTALSPRECEIINLVAEGYPNKTIGQLLQISPWTVATYVKRIFNKLNVRSRSEMIAHVLQYDVDMPEKPHV
jgi:DNA-binding CsgD family transcriptional regulator